MNMDTTLPDVDHFVRGSVPVVHAVDVARVGLHRLGADGDPKIKFLM